MSGIPPIYDSPYFFNEYETEYEEYDPNDYGDDEYEELLDRIEEYLEEERIIKKRILLTGGKE